MKTFLVTLATTTAAVAGMITTGYIPGVMEIGSAVAASSLAGWVFESYSRPARDLYADAAKPARPRPAAEPATDLAWTVNTICPAG
jgi:hypothetical protein